MDDFDFDLVDELCSSFCTPCLSQETKENGTPRANESLRLSGRKRTSTTNPPENPVVKKICLADKTNRLTIEECDELSTLDESALQMLVS